MFGKSLQQLSLGTMGNTRQISFNSLFRLTRSGKSKGEYMSDLSRLLNLGELNQYKIHAARYNQEAQPLDVFLSDRNE